MYLHSLYQPPLPSAQQCLRLCLSQRLGGVSLVYDSGTSGQLVLMSNRGETCNMPPLCFAGRLPTHRHPRRFESMADPTGQEEDERQGVEGSGEGGVMKRWHPVWEATVMTVKE